MFVHKYILGLDASEREIRIVLLQHSGLRFRVIEAVTLEHPPHHDDAVRALRTLLEDRGWSGYPCAWCLRGDLSSLRILDVPEGSTTPARKLAAAHIEEFEVLAGAETVTEYVVTRHGKQRSLILVVARVDTIMRELQCPREAGLDVVEVTPDAIALYTGLQRLLPRSHAPTIVLDMNPEESSWMVGQGGSLLHVRRLSIGSAALQDPADPERVFQRWLEDVHQSWRAYRTQYEAALSHPERLVLSGVPLFTPDQIARLSETLGLPVVSCEPHYALQEPSHYAAALGAAFCGLGHAHIDISLLPPTLRSVEATRRRLRAWVISCAALLLAMGVVLLNARNDLAWRQRQLADKEKQAEHLMRVDEELDTLKERNRVLRLQMAPLRAAIRNNLTVIALLNALHEARNTNDWISLISDAPSYFSDRQLTVIEANPVSNPTSAFRRMIVEGYTPVEDLSTVRAMIEALRAHPFIVDIDLLPDDQIRYDETAPTDWVAGYARKFALEIECAGGTP